MSRTEEERYQIPERYFLNRRNLARDLLRHDANGSAGYLVVQPTHLAFNLTDQIYNQDNFWQIYQASNLAVPNFPDGYTTINAQVGLYNPDQGFRFREDKVEQVILRISESPIDPDEFKGDLESFTKLFIQRPAVGVDAFVGGVTRLLGGMGIPILPEKLARRRIPDLGKYMAGESASSALDEMKQHYSTVTLQKDLYRQLREEGFNLSADQFLEEIYEGLPSELISEREVAKEYFEEQRSRLNRNAFEQADHDIASAAFILARLSNVNKRRKDLLHEMDDLCPGYSQAFG
jgi:hypothetical protein